MVWLNTVLVVLVVAISIFSIDLIEYFYAPGIQSKYIPERKLQVYKV